MSAKSRAQIRPIILAGGLGTRLRPRTLNLPKPLLPIDGRPLLWYALSNAFKCEMQAPIVTLDYKADLIEAYFSGCGAKFVRLPDRSMADAFLDVAESEQADAFLGMSSDVLFPYSGVEKIIGLYEKHNIDIALFVRLPNPGHKKWEFIVDSDRLIDIKVASCESSFERLLLIIQRQTIQALREKLGKNIRSENIPTELKGYQTGWTLLLKCLVQSKIPVFSQIVNIPVQNVNVPDDLIIAEEFVRAHISHDC